MPRLTPLNTNVANITDITKPIQTFLLRKTGRLFSVSDDYYHSVEPVIEIDVVNQDEISTLIKAFQIEVDSLHPLEHNNLFKIPNRLRLTGRILKEILGEIYNVKIKRAIEVEGGWYIFYLTHK